MNFEWITFVERFLIIDFFFFLVTQGPQGIVMEITPEGEEVWRYICPVVSASYPGSVQFIRQGSTNFGSNVGSRSLFRYVTILTNNLSKFPR